MKKVFSIIKPYIRWFILGGTLFFLLKTFKDRITEISEITIDSQGLGIIAIGLIVTLIAHVWSGWVWTWILKSFNISLEISKGIKVYLTTNIAKYIPGNIWHFYGRINVISKISSSLSVAACCVLLEPLLMAASALLIATISTSLRWIKTDLSFLIFLEQTIALLVVLIGIHPYILNPIIKKLAKSKKLEDEENEDNLLQQYPIFPFLGEMGFVLLRGLGFILIFIPFQPITLSQIPQLLSAFSIAWLLGLVVPGAPGGVGVFEATAIASLDPSLFPPATVLVVVAIYRVISILAEAIAAFVAWIMDMKS